jgi:Na+-translocating ferredoxin:NAD+ oxidoreductase RnfD subunit
MRMNAVKIATVFVFVLVWLVEAGLIGAIVYGVLNDKSTWPIVVMAVVVAMCLPTSMTIKEQKPQSR